MRTHRTRHASCLSRRSWPARCSLFGQCRTGVVHVSRPSSPGRSVDPRQRPEEECALQRPTSHVRADPVFESALTFMRMFGLAGGAIWCTVERAGHAAPLPSRSYAAARRQRRLLPWLLPPRDRSRRTAMPGAKFGVDQPCGPCDEQTQQLGPSSQESHNANVLEGPHLANKPILGFAKMNPNRTTDEFLCIGVFHPWCR